MTFIAECKATKNANIFSETRTLSSEEDDSLQGYASFKAERINGVCHNCYSS